MAPKVDTTVRYEIHRPKALGSAATRELMLSVMGGKSQRKFERARQRADTAGPLMVGEEISVLSGKQVDEIYTEGLLGGANPCCVEDNGHVLIGHFEFVPVKEE